MNKNSKNKKHNRNRWIVRSTSMAKSMETRDSQLSFKNFEERILYRQNDNMYEYKILHFTLPWT